MNIRRWAAALACTSGWLASGLDAIAQSDVTQPGDPVIASSSNSPGSEGVANAIDGKPTKYLNFDSRNAEGRGDPRHRHDDPVGQ